MAHSRAKTRLLALAAVCVALAGAYLILAPGSADAEQMRSLVDRYWTSIEYVWPAEYRAGNPRELPQRVRREMRDAHLRVIREVTTGKLAAWEESVDPSGFLESMRASGSVITDSGHKILSMSDPKLVSPGVATSECLVRSWSEEYLVDSAGNASEPYRPDNQCVYRYTFRKVDGEWRIESEDMITSPL